MDSNDVDFEELREALGKSLEYQTDKMVADIMSLLRAQTIDVINSICSALGADWVLGGGMIYSSNVNDAKYHVHYGVSNRVDSSLDVFIFVSAEVINNEFIVKFRDKNAYFKNHIQNIIK